MSPLDVTSNTAPFDRVPLDGRVRRSIRVALVVGVVVLVGTALVGPIGGVAADGQPDSAAAIDVDEHDELEDESILGPAEFEFVLDAIYEPPVQEYEEVDDVGYLTVVSHSFGDVDALAGEMGTVSGVYSVYVADADDPPERLVVDVLEIDGETPAGSYVVETEWAEAYNDGELTGELLGLYLMETIEVPE